MDSWGGSGCFFPCKRICFISLWGVYEAMFPISLRMIISPFRMVASDRKMSSLKTSSDSSREFSSSSRFCSVHRDILDRRKSRARVHAASLKSGDGIISVLLLRAWWAAFVAWKRHEPSP